MDFKEQISGYVPFNEQEERDKKLIMECIMDLLHGEHLGIWIDNGKAYIDLSEHIATKREAMKAGKERKQLSIWNWKAGEAIAC